MVTRSKLFPSLIRSIKSCYIDSYKPSGTSNISLQSMEMKWIILKGRLLKLLLPKPWLDSPAKPNILSLIATKLACNSNGGGKRITRLCAYGVSWYLENEGDIKPWRGENYVVDCCSKISKHEGSMYLASFHGSGMGPESIVDCD